MLVKCSSINVGTDWVVVIHLRQFLRMLYSYSRRVKNLKPVDLRPYLAVVFLLANVRSKDDSVRDLDPSGGLKYGNLKLKQHTSSHTTTQKQQLLLRMECGKPKYPSLANNCTLTWVVHTKD